MLAMVVASQSHDGGIVENDGRVAAGELATENTLAAQQCPGKGTVDLADEDLVVAAPRSRQNERRPTNAQSRIVAANPVGLVASGHEELCHRRRRRGQRTGAGENEQS